MAYQIFAKGKEITGVESSIITSTSQWAIPVGDNSTLTGLSTTGFTITNNFGAPITMRVNLSLTNLVVGQTYTLNFTGTSTPAGGYIAVNFLLYGETNPDNVTFTEISTSVYTLTKEFTAVESSAIIEFRSYNGNDGDVFVGSGISVTTAGTGFNGVYELDVLKGSPFTLDFNFKDIKDLKSKGSHSYNFRLPSSDKNDDFFGSYFQVGSYYSEDNFSFNPFGMVECYVLKDTIEVFKGNLQLTNIYLKNKNSYEYECILFSEEVGFSDVIKGIKFNALDYAGWNHELSAGIVYNSYALENLSNGEIIWSLWDYGIGHASNEYINYFRQENQYSIFNSSAFNIKRLRPQVKLKALIDKVFDFTGYQYKSDFFDSTDFGKIYMDLNYNKKDTIYTEVADAVYTTAVQRTTTQNILNSTSSIASRRVLFNDVISDETSSYNIGNNYWSANASGVYSFTISGTITPSATPANGTENVAFQLWDGWDGGSVPIGGVDTDTLEWFDTISVGANAVEFSQTIQIDRNVGAFAYQGLRLGLWCGVIANNSITWALSNMKMEVTAVDVDSTSTNLVYINGLFGDLSIENWWKSIVTKFNLVALPNKHDSKILKIEPYNDFVDTGDTKDWSNKIDYTKDVQIIPPTKFCGKKVKFKDAISNDYVYQSFKRNPFDKDEPSYGEHIVPTIRNQFADKDTEFTSIFVPTINYPLNNGAFNLGVYSCAIWKRKENGEKENTGGIRLSFFHGTKILPNNLTYYLGQGDTYSGGTANIFNKYPFFSAYSEKDFTDGTDVWTLNWQETLTSAPQDWDALPSYGLARKFWNNYIIDNFNVNSRMLSAYIRLQPKDIADFSFADTIQLMGQNYRVNSIKGYPVSSNGNCKVELLLTNKSTFIPTAPITGGGGVIVGDNQIECDWIYSHQAAYTNILMFTTSTDSTPTPNIPQDCCLALAYSWLEVPGSVNGYYCFMTEFPDLPDEDTSELRSQKGNKTNNASNNISGTANESKGANNDIIGTGNIIGEASINNRVEGDYNTLARNIGNTIVYGSNNDLITYSEQRLTYGESLVYETSITGSRISGNYGRLMITGDNVFADGVSGLLTGSQQRGEFSLNFAYDGNNRDQLIGQYGVFVMTENYNSTANKNGFRFTPKTNITLKIVLTGSLQEASNQAYSDKCIINQTVVISNYRNPIIAYSNVDSSVEDSVFGVTTLECYSLSKLPYFNQNNGGFIAFKLSNDARKDISWSLKVSYETTVIPILANDAVNNPLSITDCKLWLDASNEASLTLAGTAVTQWNDISGQDNHVSQSSTTYKPTYIIDNWQRPYLDFDGSSAFLQSTDSGLLGLSQSSNTFVAVYKSDVTTAEAFGQCIVGINDTSSIQRIGLRVNASAYGGAGADSVAFSSQSSFTNMNACNIGTAGVTDLSIAIGTRSGTALTINDGNGNSDTGTTGANDTTVNKFCVGASSNNGTDNYEFNGKIYELICYSKALTSTEIQQVIAYLKNKWSII